MASILFEDWVWSYSRLKSFEQCPYAFAQKYLYKTGGGADNFYSSFGSLMHKVLEMWYKGELGNDQADLIGTYVKLFPKYMDNHYIPKDMKAKYFLTGMNYFKGNDVFAPPPASIVGVEKRLNFNLDEYKFVGVIDLVFRNPDGTLSIMDHKSHNLRPRSNRVSPTKYDEDLDEYLKQLFLYAYAVENETGERVSRLMFNCFKNRLIIDEPCDAEGQKQAIEWATTTIHHIENCLEFEATPDFFYCKNLCDSRIDCEYNEFNE